MALKSAKYAITIYILFTVCKIGYPQLYVPKAYHEKDGLPSNIVAGIGQDAEGLLWFLTDQGLCSYDGISWKKDTSQTPPKGWHNHLLSFKDKTLLAAGFDQQQFKILYYDNQQWIDIPFNPTNGYTQYFKTAVAQGDGFKKFAFNTLNYIYEYDFYTSKWDSLKLPEEKHPDIPHIRSLRYINDTLYLTTAQQIYVRQPGAKKLGVLKTNDDKGYIHIYSIDNGKNKFIIGNGWIKRIYNHKTELIANIPDKTLSESSYITDDGEYNIYFTSSEWFYRFNTQTHELFQFKIQDHNAAALRSRLFIDEEKNFWVITYRGAYKVNSFRFTSYNKSSGLLENEGTAILELKPGVMFIGSSEGYSIINKADKSIRPYDLGTMLMQKHIQRIFDIEKSPTGTYIAGGILGFGILQEDFNVKWHQFPELDRVETIHISDSNIYLSNHNHIYKKTGSSLQKAGDIYAYTRQITELPDGRLCAVTNAGLTIFEHGTSKTILYKHEASSNFYVLKNINGHTYIGSHIGLLELKNDSIFHAPLHNYNITQPIYDMLKTRDGKIWLGTANGVYIIDEGRMKHYTQDDGLIGNEVNRNSFYEDSHGRIWIGTSEGVSYYDPEMDSEIPNPEKVDILYIKNKNEVISEEELSDLSHQKNDLEFFFRTISFTDEQKTNYRLRLIGLEKEWRYINNHQQNSILYTSLPYGKDYQLEIQASIGNGPWSPSTLSSSISIDKPFYITWWFIIGCVLFAIMLGYMINYYINQIELNTILKKTVEEKTAQITASQKELKNQNNQLLEEIEVRKIAETERSKLIHELTKINKELDWFIYSASHDLTAPIKSMRGLLNIMLIEEQKELYDRYLPLLQKSLSQLETFTKELIDFSRNARAEVSRDPIQFKKLISVVIENFRFLDNFEHISISIETGKEADQFITDSLRLRVILTNILSNAVNYHDLEKSEPFIKISSYRDNGSIFIKVNDNGQGINSAMQPNIFNMFYRANENSKGSGLGLYIVKEAVDKIGGKISLASDLGIGTTVTLEIPQTE
ncbi:ATP-binding protein [Fulvivirga maritima]|uniref:sensor histidine kinase n=1 Tax=Fulvivirga maritima TaxID=2904247 RepID=UPI001F1C06F2|nr:ATP-binding protein [Fulvivirga maritima]UII28567.1 ATP-binding protein [Fulvivirga maritima]